jgi:predicted phosphodiesterase
MVFRYLCIAKYNIYTFFCMIFFAMGVSFQTLSLPATAASDQCYVVPPYVIRADHSQAKIVWITPRGIPGGEVLIQSQNGGNEKRYPAVVSIPGFHQVDLNNPAQYHDLDLQRQLVKITDLQPYTRYDYQVLCGDGETTSSGSFKTAPEPGEEIRITFVATADAHANRQGGTYYRPIAEAVGEEEPDFMIHVGDYKGQSGSHWSSWPAYFRIGRPYLEKTVHWPVVGGHDVNKARNFRGLFAFNDPDGDPSIEDNAGSWYTFTYGNTQFFVLDHVYDMPKQLEWVEKELQASEAKWKIVAIHEMQMSVGGFPRLLGGVFREFADAFEKFGVDVVLKGHNHIYERILPLGSGGIKPVNYICVNSGGFNTLADRPSPIIASGGVSRLELNYAHFEINGNRLVMEAKLADGSVFDRLELIKDEDGMYQEEIMDKALDLDLALKIAYAYSGDVSDRDIREDPGAEFTDIPEPNKALDVILDLFRFPAESALIVYEQTDPIKWQTKDQIIEFVENEAIFEVIAPETLTLQNGDFNPVFEIEINMVLDGRKFESAVIRPVTKIGPKSLEKVDIISPQNLSNTDRNPIFSWKELRYASNYQFQLTSSNFASPTNIVIDTTTSNTNYQLPVELDGDQSYRWRVRGINQITTGPWSDAPLFFTARATSSDDMLILPNSFSLDQNYPNPFNPHTNIRFGLPVDSYVRIILYDSIGRIVAVLLDDNYRAGYHSFPFNGSQLSSGMYFFRLEANPFGESNEKEFMKTRGFTIIK